MAIKPNLFSEVLDGMMGVIDEVSDAIAFEFKGKDPFDREKVSDEEMLLEYNMSGYEKFSEIANTQGMPSAVAYRDEMEALKAKRSR